MSDNEGKSERNEYTNKVRRLSSNELNAASRNVVEEKRLNVHLSILRNEQKRNDYVYQKTLHNINSFIKNVALNTGSIKEPNGSQQKPPLPLSAVNKKTSYGGFMNQLLSANSSSTTFQSSSSSEKVNHHHHHHHHHKHKEHHLRGASMNFNDILEITDTSDSEVEAILDRDRDFDDTIDEEDEDAMLRSTRVNVALKNRVKSTQLVKEKQSTPGVYVTKTRPLTTHALSSKFISRQQQQKQQPVESTHRSRPPPVVMYECRTAPIERRRSGFKTEVYDDDIILPKKNIASWLRYKNEKKKREKMGKYDAVFEDERLERMYYELCAQRDQVPHKTPEQISLMKQRDPIFAKRYNQFMSAKTIGKPAHYDMNDLNTKQFIPKWTIQREKEILMSEGITQEEIIRKINNQRQQFFNNKVKNFIQDLSST